MCRIAMAVGEAIRASYSFVVAFWAKVRDEEK